MSGEPLLTLHLRRQDLARDQRGRAAWEAVHETKKVVPERTALLLCDEPLTSLDLANQQAVVRLIDRHRRERNAAVLLVTHDINPVLDQVDRILYLAGGRFMLGRPDEVLNSQVLSDLYGAPVYVLRAGDRLVVVGAPDAEAPHHHHHGEVHG